MSRVRMIIVAAAIVGACGASDVSSFVSPSADRDAMLARLSNASYPSPTLTKGAHENEAQDKALVAVELSRQFGARFEIVNSSYNWSAHDGFEALAVKDTYGGANGQIYIVYVGTNDRLDGFADVDLFVETKISPRIDSKNWSEINSKFLDGQTRQAQAFYDSVKSKASDSSIIVTGHSLGGLLAQVVAATRNVQAVTFSAPGMPDSLVARNNIEVNKTFDILNYSRSTDKIGMFGENLGTTVKLGKAPGAEEKDYFRQHSIASLSSEMVLAFPAGELVAQPSRSSRSSANTQPSKDGLDAKARAVDHGGSSTAVRASTEATTIEAERDGTSDLSKSSTANVPIQERQKTEGSNKEATKGAGEDGGGTQTKVSGQKDQEAASASSPPQPGNTNPPQQSDEIDGSKRRGNVDLDRDDDDEMKLEILDKKDVKKSEQNKDSSGADQNNSDKGSQDKPPEATVAPQTYWTEEEATERELRVYERSRQQQLQRLVPKPDVDPRNPGAETDVPEDAPSVTIKEKPNVDPRPDQEDDFVSATSQVLAAYTLKNRPEVDPLPPEIRESVPPPAPPIIPDVDKSMANSDDIPSPSGGQPDQFPSGNPGLSSDVYPSQNLAFRTPPPFVNSSPESVGTPGPSKTNCIVQSASKLQGKKVFAVSFGRNDTAEPEFSKLIDLLRAGASQFQLQYSQYDAPMFLSMLESGLTSDYDLFVVDETESSESLLKYFISESSQREWIATKKFVALAGKKAADLSSLDNVLVVKKNMGSFANAIADAINDNFTIQNIGVFGVKIDPETKQSNILVAVGEALSKFSRSSPKIISTSISNVDLLNALSDGVNVILTDPEHFEDARISLGSGFGGHSYKLVAISEAEVVIVTSETDSRPLTLTNTYGEGTWELIAGLAAAWMNGAKIDFGGDQAQGTCSISGTVERH
ncbi:lipase family protein [Agrobacterium tumefaciens]|uniref:lipase family protein n=1 Tax=Agrobacterium tumefaciens TaxID=358 RepID=UPI003BA39A18